jgi:hypothetical protein
MLRFEEIIPKLPTMIRNLLRVIVYTVLLFAALALILICIILVLALVIL